MALLQRVYDVTTDASLDYEAKTDQLLELGCETLDLPYAFLTRIEGAEPGTADGRQTIVEAHGEHELLQPGESCPLSGAYCRKTIETDGLLAFESALTAGWADDPGHQRFDLGCYTGGRSASTTSSTERSVSQRRTHGTGPSPTSNGRRCG